MNLILVVALLANHLNRMRPVVTPASRSIFNPMSINPGAASQALVPIGMLAKRAGSNIETIRFYEKIGVMPKPSRTEGGHRMYSPAHIERLIFIRRTRELGFTLEEVRALLRLSDGRETACSDVKAIAASHLTAIKDKIADLRAMEIVLTTLIQQCEDGAGTDCPIIETLSQNAVPGISVIEPIFT
jgi:MerR family mercuric resistance operon transcriptional regulator